MGYFISKTEGYYEGDRISFEDEEVSQRPDASATWSGKKWVAGIPRPELKETDPVAQFKVLLATPEVKDFLKTIG